MGYIFISYSSKDKETADAIRALLDSNNIETWIAPYDIPAGSNYAKVINDAIKNASAFLLVLSDAAQNSLWVERELERAITYHKPILPVQLENVEQSLYFQFMLSEASILNIIGTVPDAEEAERLIGAARALTRADREPTDEEKKELLYSQIIDLQHGDTVLFCEKLFELIALTAESLKSATRDDVKLNILRQLISLYKLYGKNPLGYGNEYKETARSYFDISSEIHKAVYQSTAYSKLLLYSALAIAVLREEKKAKDDCIDCYTNGDVRREQSNAFEELLSPFASVVLNLNYDTDYTEDEVDFINEIHRYVVTESYKNVSYPAEKKKEEAPVSDNQFQAIADYFAKGNELFCAMENNNQAEDFFNCLLLSYERLKNYCNEVGAKKTYSDCVIKISELKQSRLKKRAIKSAPTAAERGIKALLGLTMPESGSFDAFISYKHYDEDRAFKVYSFLQQNLKEVFFDKESLPELSKSDYEHAVMTALGRSKHFIVLVSKLEILESSDFIEGDWVRREMRTFNTEIQEGRKKDSNFIILASDEVCDEIFAKNKENIDIMWRWPEIIRFSEFEKVLAKYIR